MEIAEAATESFAFLSPTYLERNSTMQFPTNLHALACCTAIVCFVAVTDSQAQSPYANPYGGYAAASPYYQRSAYQRPERYAATRPVSYTFPVRRDFSTAYAMQTDPRWGNVPQRTGVQPVTAYRPVTQLNRPNYSGQFAGHPGYGQSGCPAAFNPATTAPRVAPPIYPGDNLFGSPTLYADGEPVRNFFRYLTP